MRNPTVTVEALEQLGRLALELSVASSSLRLVPLRGVLERQAASCRREAAELLAELADEPMAEHELEAMRAGMDAEWLALSEAEREELLADEPLTEAELEDMRAAMGEWA